MHGDSGSLGLQSGRIRKMLQSNLLLATFRIVTYWLLFAAEHYEAGK